MIIKISNLSEGVHNYSFEESVGAIGLTEPFFGNFKVEAELEKSHNQFILNAEITLNANFECDRCASDYNTVIQSDYKMVYFLGKEPDDEDKLNVTYLSHEADKINLAQDIKDYSVLAIPMKKLCREDCKGLCRKCGKDLNEGDCGCVEKNIDTRWMPLQELKSKLNNN